MQEVRGAREREMALAERERALWDTLGQRWEEDRRAWAAREASLSAQVAALQAELIRLVSVALQPAAGPASSPAPAPAGSLSILSSELDHAVQPQPAAPAAAAFTTAADSAEVKAVSAEAAGQALRDAVWDEEPRFGSEVLAALSAVDSTDVLSNEMDELLIRKVNAVPAAKQAGAHESNRAAAEAWDVVAEPDLEQITVIYRTGTLAKV